MNAGDSAESSDDNKSRRRPLQTGKRKRQRATSGAHADEEDAPRTRRCRGRQPSARTDDSAASSARDRNLRRLESNERERLRMHSLNDAFEASISTTFFFFFFFFVRHSFFFLLLLQPAFLPTRLGRATLVIYFLSRRFTSLTHAHKQPS